MIWKMSQLPNEPMSQIALLALFGNVRLATEPH